MAGGCSSLLLKAGGDYMRNKFALVIGIFGIAFTVGFFVLPKFLEARNVILPPTCYDLLLYVAIIMIIGSLVWLFSEPIRKLLIRLRYFLQIISRLRLIVAPMQGYKDVGARIVIAVDYKAENGCLRKQVEDLQKQVEQLQMLKQRGELYRNNPAQFISNRLDALIVNEQNSWVSADIVIASRLPYQINITKVHTELYLLSEGGIRRRYDMETHVGQVCNSISGEPGKPDTTIRVHVDNKQLAKSLLQSLCACNCGWASVEGKIYITTSDLKTILLGIDEKYVLVSKVAGISDNKLQIL